MKERPILFNAPMVRALLNGSKTQTRRIVKQKLMQLGDGDWHSFDHKGLNYRVNARHTTVGAWANLLQFCPYGQPGDQLWVREAWRTVAEADPLPPRLMTAAYRIWFEADSPHQPGYGKYRPSMFMPRWASRIQMEIVSVRVERLQDISEADALAEGITYAQLPGNQQDDAKAITWYRGLWETINGTGSWEANPWVWCINFRRIES